ncbi:FAD-dependent oxidoreductase [Desulfoferrobacter suflitae]|uniref:FAD-dependent oxidoreductase n=1 Tax=Desulfoferrobacter suflitae TaxID=2865782 RepID=UPI0021642620|nr:FAD-dependent oxidoreductase [Desulfoferrobacter suflitae]MCK8602592.1 FAD-dependent oxidoreductase [Desulfoferrobacter suflitae]
MQSQQGQAGDQQAVQLCGMEDGRRLESRVLEERIQQAVADGQRRLLIEAYGQHGLGGRLWRAGNEPVQVIISGSSGQRVGSMGFPNTRIEVMGPASDDVGWLNAGAEIIVHGNACNGTANAMAQGKVYVAGNIGARGMTMTKFNPRFQPPELWVLGSVGDYFAEFMAGGVAVVCGHQPQDPQNILGYRPCVGMVGGKIFFRGPHKGYSQADAKLSPLSDDDWQWLQMNLRVYLESIRRTELYDTFNDRTAWQLLAARGPQEKFTRPRRSMAAFHRQVWDQELGKGGLIGDLTDLDNSPIALITTGDLRRFVPVWENRTYAAPCEASCPTGMPVQERWRLIREGRVDEAVDLALAYTPFPASVCGYLCPHLCMQGCTRQTVNMPAVDVSQLGRASIKAKLPELPPLSGKKVAVIGGGAAGLSIAWQLRRRGHEAVIYDMHRTLGGKIASLIPRSRIPAEVIGAELERIQSALPHVHLQQRLSKEDVEQLKVDYDFVVVAVGAQKPRIIPIPGKEKLIPALDFLRQSKADSIQVGKKVVIIGAGNVGCDAATEAHRLGAEEITLIDIQEPLSFGKEREEAEAAGAKFRWPCFSKAVVDEGLELTTGEVIPADTLIISVGDLPDIEFLPESVATDRGFIQVNEWYQTTDPQIFAVGDAVQLGLLTDAIGAGRKAAQAIDDMFQGKRPRGDVRKRIDYSRVKLEYFDPRLQKFDGIEQCASQCSSCGSCRDCGMCVTMCPQAAISRKESGKDFEMVVDKNRCIGCGFCAGVCPCGIWDLVENDPIG